MTLENIAQDKKKVQRRRGKVGSITALRRILWRALEVSEGVLESSSDAHVTLKAAHAIATSGGTYSKITSDWEIERRLRRLEARMGEIP